MHHNKPLPLLCVCVFLDLPPIVLTGKVRELQLHRTRVPSHPNMPPEADDEALHELQNELEAERRGGEAENLTTEERRALVPWVPRTLCGPGIWARFALKHSCGWTEIYSNPKDLKGFGQNIVEQGRLIARFLTRCGFSAES